MALKPHCGGLFFLFCAALVGIAGAIWWSSLPVAQENQPTREKLTSGSGVAASPVNPNVDLTPDPDRNPSNSSQPRLVPLSRQAGANHALAQLPRRARPAVPSSRVDLQALKDQENLQPSLDPEASILQPGTQPFEILVSGVPEVVHAALNEVYVQRPDGTAEILEIPPVQDLAGWEASARELSQTPEVVLYRPELPRAEANLVTLGTTMILTAESPATANEIIAAENWRLIEAPVYAPGRYIVAAASPVVTLEALRRWKQLGRSNLEGNFRKVLAPRNRAAQAAALRKQQAAQKAPPNKTTPAVPAFFGRFSPDDTLFGEQWHLLNTGQGGGAPGIDANVRGAWQLWSGQGVTIAIVDDGLQLSHPDLVANLATNRPTLHHDWNDATPDDPTPGASNPHGTACAGVAAARGGNNLGVTGAAPFASLAGLRLIAAPSTDRQQAEALAWRIQEVDISSNSWGPTDNGPIAGPGPLTTAALETAATRGRGGKGNAIFFAAGNGYSFDNSNYDGYANSIYVIAISAVGNDGVASSYSEPGGNIALSAPSNGGTRGITTTDLAGAGGYSSGDYTSSFGGTSAACPLAAGVAALLLQANPSLSWRDVKEILMRSATPIDTGSTTWVNNAAGIAFSTQYGAGMVNATAAVELAADWENLLPMTSASGTTGTVNLLVPDNNQEGVTVEIPIGANFRVESIQVNATVRTTYRGDLVASITSPAGTEIDLVGAPRGDGVDNWNAIPLTSPHFWGERSNGTWKVRIADVLAADRAFIQRVDLVVYGSFSPSPPANDAFANAQLFTGTSASFITSNRGATRQPNEPRHAREAGGGSLWWLYRPEQNGYLTLDTRGSEIDTLVAVYRGGSLLGLEEVFYNDDISSSVTASQIARIPVVAGQELRIAVDGKNRARGALRLNARLEVAALYDHFADAVAMTGVSWSHAWSNLGSGSGVYTAQGSEPNHAGNPARRSVWYVWRPTANGSATVTTRGSALDTVLAVYQGNQVGRLRAITSNDNETGGRKSSRVIFGVRNGETYYLAVDGKNGATGTYTLTATMNGAVAPAPANDDFVNPIPIAGAPLRLSGVNMSATGQTGEPGGVQRTSVWYAWTAPHTGVVTVTTDGSTFDTTLGAYIGNSVVGLNALPAFPTGSGNAVNDNVSSTARWSRIRFSVTAGNVYYLRLDGARGATGRFTLRISY